VHSTPASPGAAGARGVSAISVKPSRRGTPALATFAVSWRISTRSIPSTANAVSVSRRATVVGDSAAREGRVDPVADLQHARAAPVMEPGASRDAVVDDDGEVHVAAFLPLALPTRQHLAALLERLRLVRGPRHPRPQVLETLDDRLVLELRVGHAPAPQDDAVALDALRQHRRT
jgi:hypothetical protein